MTSTNGARGKLTKAQRQQIIELKGKMTQVEIADRFGVRFQTVSRWHRTDPNRPQKSFPFDVDEDAKLKEAVAQGLRNKDIADLLGRSVISVAARKHRMRRDGLLPPFRGVLIR